MDTKYKRPIWFDYKILRMRTTKLMNVIINSNCILPPNLLKRRETVKQSAIQFNVSITPSCRTNWCVYIWLLLRGCGGEGKNFFSALYVVKKKPRGKPRIFADSGFTWDWISALSCLAPLQISLIPARGAVSRGSRAAALWNSRADLAPCARAGWFLSSCCWWKNAQFRYKQERPN